MNTLKQVEFSTIPFLLIFIIFLPFISLYFYIFSASLDLTLNKTIIQQTQMGFCIAYQTQVQK